MTTPAKTADTGNRILPHTCACERGYSDGGPTLGCIICNSPCKTCKSYSTTDCIDCVDTYYIEGSICNPCTLGCKTCPGDPNNCTACIDGYFMKESGTPCIKCPSPCATCFNENYCITCGYGASKRIRQPTCICEHGLSDNEEECLTCISPCKTCFEA